jgi:hypothetical protein
MPSSKAALRYFSSTRISAWVQSSASRGISSNRNVREDIELARFSRERDPNRIEDTIALPFPKE